MFYGWEGNHRSGVALAMRHRLSGLSTYGSKANVREMSTPLMFRWNMVSIYFFTPSGRRGASCEVLTITIGQRASILQCFDCPIENAR